MLAPVLLQDCTCFALSPTQSDPSPLIPLPKLLLTPPTSPSPSHFSPSRRAARWPLPWRHQRQPSPSSTTAASWSEAVYPLRGAPKRRRRTSPSSSGVDLVAGRLESEAGQIQAAVERTRRGEMRCAAGAEPHANRVSYGQAAAPRQGEAGGGGGPP